jgi:hypothetical protein
MKLARALTEGVGSWLHFEYSCDKSGLFSEKYLTAPIGQILHSRLGSRVLAEHRHPVLAPLMQGRGRRPEVDFVVFSEYPKIRVAVESKWIGEGRIDVQAVIWDLIRLELIAHAEGAECFFVLGGQRGNLERLFANEQFAGQELLRRRPLLATTDNFFHKVYLTPVVPSRIDLLRRIFADFQDFQFPTYMGARRSTPFPAQCPLAQYQVYTWKITSAVPRNLFTPKNSFHYVAPGPH